MPDNAAWLLEQHLEVCLATLYELTQYAVLPQSAHYASAALLCESSSRCDISTVSQSILERMKAEWKLVTCVATGEFVQLTRHFACSLSIRMLATVQGGADCHRVCWIPA